MLIIFNVKHAVPIFSIINSVNQTHRKILIDFAAGIRMVLNINSVRGRFVIWRDNIVFAASKLEALVAGEIKCFGINRFVRPNVSSCVSDNIIKSFVKLLNAIANKRAMVTLKCNSNLSISRVNCGD